MGDREITEQNRPSRETEEHESIKEPRAKRQRFGLLRRSARGLGWLFASPGAWFGLKTIRAGAASIGQTYEGIRAPQSRDRRFKTQGDRVFDLVSTAFAYGITIEALERRLAIRRRQTALLAYGLFTMGCVLLMAWASIAIRTASHGGRIVLLLQFLPFLALFFLMSFYQALINYQIRTGRTANWRDYIFAEKDFLPR